VTTATPCGRISTRSASRYLSAAAFDALYALDPGRPRTPATLATPTSVPRRAAISGPANGSKVATIPK
jgi:hypothetical protein